MPTHAWGHMSKGENKPVKHSHALLLVLALILAACGGGPTPEVAPTEMPTQPPAAAPTSTTEAQLTPPPSEPTDLTGTQWRLVSFGPRGSEAPTVGDQAVTLEFGADGQAGGSAGCNSYGGDYRVEGGSLVMGEIIRTLMACADERVNEQENRYLAALQSAGPFEISGDQLVIQYGDGQDVLNLKRAGP